MAYNLTTRYLCKRYLGLDASDTGSDARIDALIDPVSLAIANYCGRVFETATYKVWLDGTGMDRMLLPEWPVTRLVQVCTHSAEAIRIQVDTSTATWGSVYIDGSTLTLQWVDTSGVDQTQAITISGTIADLAALIDAVSGWSTETVSGYSTQPATLLQNLEGGSALAPDRVDLDLPDDPVNARRSATSKQSIEVGGVFPHGHKNIFTWYVAGYTLPVDNAGHTGLDTAGDVPADLTLVANQILQDVLDSSKAGRTMAAEKFTNYSYTRGYALAGGEGWMGKYVSNYAIALSAHRSMRLMVV